MVWGLSALIPPISVLLVLSSNPCIFCQSLILRSRALFCFCFLRTWKLPLSAIRIDRQRAYCKMNATDPFPMEFLRPADVGAHCVRPRVIETSSLRFLSKDFLYFATDLIFWNVVLHRYDFVQKSLRDLKGRPDQREGKKSVRGTLF